MLLYEDTDKDGKLDVETKIYIDKSENIVMYQYIYQGPKVISTSEVIIELKYLTKIVNSAWELKLSDFLKDYKVE